MSLEIAIDGGGRSSVHPVSHPQGAVGAPLRGESRFPHSGESFDDSEFETIASNCKRLACGLRGKVQQVAGAAMAG